MVNHDLASSKYKIILKIFASAAIHPSALLPNPNAPHGLTTCESLCYASLSNQSSLFNFLFSFCHMKKIIIT